MITTIQYDSRILLSPERAERDIQVVRYLQHYGKVSAFSAYDGRISDIDLGGITISCRGRTYRVPFEPSMTSYREARERVVELDKECRKALGHSDVTVKTYLPPTGLYAVEFAVITATFLGYSQRWWFARGQVVERYAGPAFASFSWQIQPYLITGMVIIHLAEMIYFASQKLAKHSVSPRSATFWLWTVTTFIEGGFAMTRFSNHVQAQRVKQKH